MSEQSQKRKNDDAMCSICQTNLKRLCAKDRRSIISEQYALDASKISNKRINVNDVICRWCYCKINKQILLEKKQSGSVRSSSSEQSAMDISQPSTSAMGFGNLPSSQPSEYQSQSSNEDTPYVQSEQSKREVFEVPYCRTISSHSHCFICSAADNMKVIPIEARLKVFEKRRIFVPKGNRCCSHHLIGKWLYEEHVGNIVIVSERCQMDEDEMNIFFETSDSATRLNHVAARTMSDDHLYALTGHKWQHLDQLQNMMTSMRNTDNRTKIEALFVFLNKLLDKNISCSITNS